MNHWLASTDIPWRGMMTLFSLLMGACIGSFLNVCIYRIPRDMSLSHPGSHCPHCHQPIRWWHNIPVLAWCYLRGKCAYCRASISPRYALVELLTATLFLLAWLKFDISEGVRPLHLVPVTDIWLVPVFWLVIMGLVVGTFVDFEHMIIPDRVTWGGMLCGVLISLLVPSLHGSDTIITSLIRSVIGASVGFGLLWAVAVLGEFIFKKEAMGFGDVKLLGAIGAFFGWQSVCFTILMSSLAGTLVGLVLIALGKKEMQSRIPYGPYLAVAALLWMFWGSAWWDLYLQFITVDT